MKRNMKFKIAAILVSVLMVVSIFTQVPLAFAENASEAVSAESSGQDSAVNAESPGIEEEAQKSGGETQSPETVPDVNTGKETEASASEEPSQDAGSEAAADEDQEQTEEASQTDDASKADENEQTGDEDADGTEETGEEDAEEEKTEETEEADESEEEEEEVKLNQETLAFKGKANGLSVKVTAEAETFPEGTEMKVTKVASASVSEAVEAALGTDSVELRAVDITFYDADGKEVQPLKDVNVRLSSSAFADDAEISVVHMEKPSSAQADVIATDTGSTASFSADHFSTYVLAAEVKAAEGEEEADPEASETWTVTFYNRDAEVYQTVKVTKGEAIGELPAVIARDDYNAYWAIGEIVEGAQGSEISVTGDRIDATYEPTADTVIVPDYDKITYTVTFYEEDKETVVGTKTVDVDSNYCVNDIPTVPEKSGYTGKWVYSGGDFDNTVAASADMNVWAEYEQNVFTVKFMVGEDVYESDP